ncbi:hypothetical protein [Knoellia remsis]|uniref:hypothetical protein n=1 Tax=Knoellia remsis TaxID=407159 RepID=UPI000D0633AE|nr:hypothetical protein [Knoellia remsis]
MTTAASKTSRHRVRATLAAAALGTSLLGGCVVFNPIQTDYAYQPADGVNATFGDLEVRGLVVVSNAKGTPGNLAGQVINRSSEDVQLTFQSEGSAGAQATVKRQSSLTLGEGEGKPVTLDKVEVAPGETLELQVSTPATGLNLLLVPVLPSTGYYEDAKPSGAPPAPSPDTTESEGSGH